jgi:acetyltransferase-like isoleucine patch superfamily enzyme
MVNFLKNRLKERRFKKKWRKLNPHNRTIAGNIFDITKVSVGKGTKGVLNVRSYASGSEMLEIGNYCSLGVSATFILGGNHYPDRFLAYPSRFMFENKLFPPLSKGPIVIKDDAYIPINVIVLSGVTIGKGAMIGAGSVVAKDIPDFAIAVGNPCKVVKYRFDEQTRDRLSKIDYGLIDKEFYLNHKNDFNQPISSEFIDLLEQKHEEYIKKI